MLFVFVDGPGEVMVPEAEETIRSLVQDTKCPPGDAPWFCFVVEDEPSKTMRTIVEFANRIENLWYSIIVAEGVDPDPIFHLAGDRKDVRKPYDYVLEYIKNEPTDGEESQVVVLLGSDFEVVEKSPLDYLVSTCNKRGIPVVDMADQMMTISFTEAEATEEVDEGDDAVEQTEVDEKFDEIAQSLVAESVESVKDSLRGDLEEERRILLTHTKKELLNQAAREGKSDLILDARKKDSIVDALLRDKMQALEPEDPEAAALDEEEPIIDERVQGEASPIALRPSQRMQSQSWGASADDAAEANEAPDVSPMAVSIAVVDGMLQLTIDPTNLSRDFLVKIKANGALEFA